MAAVPGMVPGPTKAQPGMGAPGSGGGRDTPGAGKQRGQFEKDRQGRMQGSGGPRPPIYTPPKDYRGGYQSKPSLGPKTVMPGSSAVHGMLPIY